tara:strand:- start:679 stop:867 length:189 start_codon:yes stop_codon:yes gene_type:complete
MFVLKHDEDKCIKCGMCVSLCDNWVMKEGEFPKPVKAEVEEIGCNQKAADGCPVNAIIISEK